MRKSRDSTLQVDGQTLNYQGRVFPLGSIAWFEKHHIKRGTGIGKVISLTVLVAVAVGAEWAANYFDLSTVDLGTVPPIIGSVFLGSTYLLWIIYLIRRRKKFALVLQTNAGDSPRMLTSHDEDSLDSLLDEVTKRLEPGNDLPPLTAIVNNNRITIGDVTMGDKINVSDISGSVVQVGPNAQAHDINFNQKWGEIDSDIDLGELAAELTKLYRELRDEADAAEQFVSLASVKRAEEAASSGDGAKALENLKSAGAWVLGAAEKIGLNVATKAIEYAIGI